MNIHQLRAICEVIKQGMKISTAAEVLHKSQPGISRQVREIEDELGITIFRRRKNKIESLTPPGREVARVAERVLRDLENLRLIGKEYSRQDAGDLTIATTHTQARYSLPQVIESFTRRFPGVGLTLRQGNPVQCCELVAAGEADIAIATETERSFDELIALPAYRLARCIVARHDHPILKERRLTLAKLARFPLITFDPAFSARRAVTDAFSAAGLKPRIVLSAVDADVSKAYVERGMGIAILPRIALDPAKDRKLRALDADRLFKVGMLNVLVRKRAWLRSYMFSFISLYAPHLTRDVVQRALAGRDVDLARLRSAAPAVRRMT